MTTRRKIISRLRGSIKEVTSDSKYSNRYLWDAFWTASRVLIKRDADNERRIYQTSDIWQTLCIGMDPVSPILCDCICIPVDCVLYRSQFKIPKIVESSYGWIYRMIASLDNSKRITLVTPMEFQVKTKIRHNRELYAFAHDGYIWSNAPFPRIIISAVAEGDISQFKCSNDSSSEGAGNCGSLLDIEVGIPDYLVDGSIKLAMQEIGVFVSKPTDNAPNNSESQREQSI